MYDIKSYVVVDLYTFFFLDQIDCNISYFKSSSNPRNSIIYAVQGILDDKHISHSCSSC